MTIRQAAKFLDISHVTLIKWERENPPDSRYRNMLLEHTAEKEGEELAG
jgi:DNA-binding XRE family transcriptional regulator